MNRLAIDVDGVIADFITDFLISDYNNDPKKKSTFWKNPPYNFWINLRPLIEPAWFKKIIKDRDIIFLTNCPNATARRDWLKTNRFWTDKSCLWCNAPGEPKANALKMLAPDLFIDDYEKNWRECDNMGIPIFKFDGKSPVKSWMEIDTLLNGSKQ